MQLHANAKLGPAGRVALVELIDRGMTFRAAAAALGVSPATAHRWWHRRRASVALAPTATSAWFADRSSRPHRSPRRLSAEQERPILEARERTNLGPARLAGIVRRARSTVWKVLWRHGRSRRRRSERRQTYKRYEWAQPGALLHMDTKHLARFDRPGHWAHGDRSDRSRDVGTVYAHCVVDDHTRLAYVELHAADSAQAAAKTLDRAATWFREQGCGPVAAIMTDNALIYVRSRAFRDQLARINARHIRIPKFTPRWNGKVERFIQTLDTEWAHGRTWPNSTSRDRALNSFLRYYNRYRPHSSLNDRPPISRVHNLHGQDS